MSFLLTCHPHEYDLGPMGKRLDDIDRGQQQLRDVLDAVEAKLDTLSEMVRSRLRSPTGSEQPVMKDPPLRETVDSTIFSSSREVSKSQDALLDKLGKHSLSLQSLESMGHKSLALEIRPGFESPGSRRSSNSSVGGGGRSSSPSSIARWRNRHSMSGDSVLHSDRVGEWGAWSAWNPDSVSRTIFEGTSIPVLLYDAFLMPYRLAWNVPDDEAWIFSAMWITRIFWTLDLLLNLVTGFRNKKGVLELRLVLAVRRYLRTWFFPDAALVMCDWLAAISGNQWMQGMRVMRLVRGGRQMVRAWMLMQKAKLMIQAKGFHLAMDISLLLLVILWLNHMVCCGWYSIGKYSVSDTGYTWLTEQENPNVSAYYEYWTALHWAITQMTPGSMEVFPENSNERIYSVSTLILGLLLGSSLIATITSTMTQYKLRIETSSRKFMLLHKFLHQQGVDPQLALAIKHQVKVRSQETQRLKAGDVEYLSLVSNSLHEALFHSWCMRHLAQHPFFNALNHFDHLAVQFFCNSAIRSQEFPVSDAVFEEGAYGACMYFLAHGQLKYNAGAHAPEAGLDEFNPNLILKPGDWCSEPALWTLWTHLGTLEAESTSEVLSINGESLQRTLQRYPETGAVLVDYCGTFHKYMNEPGVAKSDLCYGFDINEMMSGMKPNVRTQLATPVIRTLELRFWGQFIDRRNLETLKDEVSNGKCDIGFVGTEPVRNTFVVALRIRKSNAEANRFLVKIGEVLRDRGTIVPHCLLPGVKRKSQETYMQAVARLLTTDLGEISSQVEARIHEGFEQSVLIEKSPSLGIRTRYLRTTIPAGLREGAKLLTLPALANVPEPQQKRGLARFFSRSAASSEDADVQRVAATMLAEHQSVVVLRCDNVNRASRKLYLWLNAAEFKALSHKMAKPIIQQWVAAIEEQTRPLHRTRRNSSVGQVDTTDGTVDETDDPTGRDSPNAHRGSF